MKNKLQNERARMLAGVYAPRPESSALMYGLIATSVAGLALFAFSRFYGLDALAHPLWIAVAAVLIFIVSMTLQFHLVRRHNAAHRAEYDKMDN